MNSNRESDRRFDETRTYVSETKVGPGQIGRYRLVRILGEGAYGLVYLGYDEELQRQVAIKVPTVKRFKSPRDADQYLDEARKLASLDHSNIVPVYDVGRTEGGAIYIVSKFIEGRTLGEMRGDRRLSHEDAAQLIAVAAGALQHAHDRRLIHRDVKPGNLLIEDRTGTPYVADFGLAIREEDYLKDDKIVGTPAYMSPEQARGEGHRLDGRSDIFSLGAVFYELLTASRPFRGSTAYELMHQVVSVEPLHPRELEHTIPAELERICLKALSKRVSDRYATAAELADDLLHWKEGPASDTAHLKIVPKGLRSFDAADADFFLELLPGPRNREGLPESIQFWKTRFEQTDPEETFSVGLIYGPSGCGKSSMVKAGLLPRLSKDLDAVYVEATPDDTEFRILRALKKQRPELPQTVGLVEAFSLLRRSEGRKVVVIVDQFEQWLHAHRAETETEFAGALRQCDGGALQAVVMVRDDFSMAASRFMRELETRIVEGHNFATVDLFDVDHAKNVLIKFGQAFGKLPSQTGKLSDDEQAFVESVASGLAQDGKVVSVRLALFAEMVKGKPWIPASLRAVGGTEGIGVNFLEETFSSREANPEHRMHQEAAREVLMTLMPELGSDIKGHMRSHAELLEASGYSGRAAEFYELLRILDGQLRLITPTDPEGFRTHSGSDLDSKFYQLTHDYLVPSLRQWLTRKQQETRKGRAELRLAERATWWAAKPENRHLPSLVEWIRIRAFTEIDKWTEPQRRMMSKAGHVHGVRAGLLLALFAAASLAVVSLRSRFANAGNDERAAGLVTALLNANIDQVPSIVNDMQKYRPWIEPRLRRELPDFSEDSNQRLHISLALLASDPQQLEFLTHRLLRADPGQVQAIRLMLAGHRDQLLPELWRVAREPISGEDKSLLQAASLLAMYDFDNDAAWNEIAERVVAALVNKNPLRAAIWLQSLRPARRYLLPPLRVVYRSASGEYSPSEIDLATNVLEDFAADDLNVLGELLLDATPAQFVALFDEFEAHGEDAIALLLAELGRLPRHDSTDPPLDPRSAPPSSSVSLEIRQTPVDGEIAAAPFQKSTPVAEMEKESLARRQANAAVALTRLGQAERVWPLLRASSDPRLRTWIIHRLSPLGASPETLVSRLTKEPDASIRRALIVSLVEFDALSLASRESTSRLLVQWYMTDPDPGIHGAAQWLLRRWGKQEEISGADEELASSEIDAGRQWYTTTTNRHTMTLVRGPVEFQMGSPSTEPDRQDDESLHLARIERSFAIATNEVTVGQFRRFLDDTGMHFEFTEKYAPQESCPQTFINWFHGAMYCRWLSEQEGIPEDQMCYPPLAEIRPGMRVPKDYLSRTGYRLPSESEWEFACRAGTTTSRFYGEADELVPKYAWYVKNSDSRTWPVASLKPNDLGLFDMYGNVWELCHDSVSDYPQGGTVVDVEDTRAVSSALRRVLRGGSFDILDASIRSANRFYSPPDNRTLIGVGVRPARTHDLAP